MRMRVLVTCLIIAVCAFGIGRAAEQRSLANFRVVVAFDQVTNEIALVCTEGCAWTNVRFSCGTNGECESPIDEYGMAE
jgi:hypothetical protein